MSDFDAIVIGAGNGGLTAAATLAKGGVKTLLLERHNVPGGCATSFCRGRFEFEVALHQLSGMGDEKFPGPLRSVLHGLDVLDSVEFLPMKNLYRLVLPDRLDITLPADRTGTVEALQKRFPAESEKIREFYDLVYAFFNQLISVFYLRDPEASREKYPLYFKYALASSQEILDEYFTDPLLKITVAAYWGYMGVPPRFLTFSDLAALIFAYIEFKPYHIRNGSQALSNALVDTFLKNGGEVRFNCGASKIELRDGAVAAVVTDRGERLETTCVVSNISSPVMYNELIGIDSTPKEKYDEMRGSTIGPSSFTLYIGMDCTPAELGIHETTNFVAAHEDMDRAFTQMRDIDEPAMVLVTCYNVSDPDASPEGTCQIAVVDLQYAEPWLSVPPSLYASEKYRYASKVLDLVERVFPGFRKHIEEIEVATPITHVRYLGHPGGAFYGFDQYSKDSRLVNSPVQSIAGLFHAGAWAAEGGFQPTLTSGSSAGRAALKHLGKRGR
jgi:phytoene dehydrogenase-like protein